MKGNTRKDWARNPFVWGLAVIVIGIIVGVLSLSGAARYNGPSDSSCSLTSSGKTTSVSCSDSANSAAMASALVGDTSDVTVLSTPLLWTSRIAFLPATALAAWTIFAIIRSIVVSVTMRIRRRLSIERRLRNRKHVDES